MQRRQFLKGAAAGVAAVFITGTMLAEPKPQKIRIDIPRTEAMEELMRCLKERRICPEQYDMIEFHVVHTPEPLCRFVVNT